jgi:uncharacterized protein
VIILEADGKRFAIYTAPDVGKNIQTHLMQHQKPRPYTHDLIDSVLKGFDIQILQIVIKDVEDTVYFARLFLQQDRGNERLIIDIDARPSDCITLALMHRIPVFCHRSVLEKTIPIEE